jgi:hypothetical protein
MSVKGTHSRIEPLRCYQSFCMQTVLYEYNYAFSILQYKNNVPDPPRAVGEILIVVFSV